MKSAWINVYNIISYNNGDLVKFDRYIVLFVYSLILYFVYNK